MLFRLPAVFATSALVATTTLFAACGSREPPVGATPSPPTAVTPGGSGAPSTPAPGAPTASAPSEPPDAAPAASGCNSAGLGTGDHELSVTVGAATRKFVLHVPNGYAGSGPLPLVLDYHPLGSNAAQWKLATGWAALADQKKFFVAWPQGHGDSWNAGRCCDPAHAEAVDDVAVARAIVAKIHGSVCVNARRVFATGCSNGGGMAFRLACDAADLVAAVAPVDFDCITGPTNSPSCATCNPSRPISVTQFRGTSDPLAPYGGGPTLASPGLTFPGATASFTDWAARNGCTGAAAARSDHAACSSYASCAAGTETTLCTIPNGLHCTDYFPFQTAAIAWETFTRSPMP